MRRMKIFIRKWAPGLQEMMLQKQSEHKMSPCDRVGRREELLIFHTEDSSEVLKGVNVSSE